MVDIVAVASDQQDPYARKWIMWADFEPGPDWSRVAAVSEEDSLAALIQINEDKHSGDTQSGSVDLPEGSHSIYFGVSQDGGSNFGTYSGTISFDGISKSFAGFDNSVIGKWDVTVRGNKVVSITGDQTPGQKQSFLDTIKGIPLKLQTELKNGMTHEFIMANWPWVALGVAVPVVAGGTYLYLTKGKGRGRRV